MIATHLRIKSPEGTTVTACGLAGYPRLAAYDPRDVDCANCKKTKRYRKATGK